MRKSFIFWGYLHDVFSPSDNRSLDQALGLWLLWQRSRDTNLS